jgi:DNA polymerase epsilon subunit 2
MQRNCVIDHRALEQHHASGADQGAEGACAPIFKSLVHTIASQAHLLPLPLEARPVYWELDHSLRLEPLPDLLVLADRVDQYQSEVENTSTQAVNPGSFASDASFLVYYPATREVELSNPNNR